MRPDLGILSKEEQGRVHDAAASILGTAGIRVGSDTARGLFLDAGAEVVEGAASPIVKIPASLIDEALRNAPPEVRLEGRDGGDPLMLSGDRVHFNPGSAAIFIEDHETYGPRPPLSKDLRDFVVLTDALDQMDMQSTALVVSDVPREVADFYRLYIVLKNSAKPVVTGSFHRDTVPLMTEMARAASGNERGHCVIFDVCPTSPFMLGDIACQNMMDCADLKVPAQVVAAPELGATAPVTIAGAVVQATAEFLALLTLSQLKNRGAPVLYGGSPITFDMKFATPSLGAIESAMLAIAMSQMGKHFNVPTHVYVGLSDSKVPDAQAGIEAGYGLIIGALAGINNISGPGMLNSESSQSFEKLVIDNEVCRSARRLKRGLDVDDDTIAKELISVIGPGGGNYLSDEHTLRHFKREVWYPTRVVDRQGHKAWSAAGSKDMASRARGAVIAILRDHSPPGLEGDRLRELDSIMNDALTDRNAGRMPEGP